MIRLRVEWPADRIGELVVGAPLRIGQHAYVIARVSDPDEAEAVLRPAGAPTLEEAVAGRPVYAQQFTMVELDLDPEDERNPDVIRFERQHGGDA